MSLVSLCGAMAATPAKELLTRVESELVKLNPYQAKIEILYGGNSIWGSYQVDDDSYYLAVGEQEMYGNCEVRYEIFNDRKEVVVDSAVTQFDGNLLSNPAAVFTMITQNYSAEVISEDEEVVTVALLQNEGGIVGGELIELTIWKSALLPKSIEYRYDDGQIVINIYSLGRVTSSIPTYNSSNYADYEVIDFR